MTFEENIRDFQLSYTFQEYKSYMNAKNSKKCLRKWELKTFYIVNSFDDLKSATVIFQRPKNVFYDIFINPERKSILGASGYIYESIKITRWIY